MQDSDISPSKNGQSSARCGLLLESLGGLSALPTILPIPSVLHGLARRAARAPGGVARRDGLLGLAATACRGNEVLVPSVWGAEVTE